MANENNFLPFGTGAGANVIDQAEYLGLPARNTGFQAGVAKSAEVNKAVRQSAFVAAMIGQFINDIGGFHALDDGAVTNLLTSFERTIQAGAMNFAIAGGTASALTASFTPAPAAYQAGMMFNVVAASAAPGAATINVNTLGIKAITDRSGAPIIPGFWQAGDILELIYDGTSFRVMGGNTVSATLFTSTNSGSQALANNTLTQVNFAAAGGSVAFGSYAPNVFTFSRPGTYAVALATASNMTFSGSPGTSGFSELHKNGVKVNGSRDSGQSNQASPVSFPCESNPVISVVANDAISIWSQLTAASGFTAASVTSATLSITPLS